MTEWDKFQEWWAKNGASGESEFPADFPFIAFKMCAWSAWNARAKLSMNADEEGK